MTTDARAALDRLLAALEAHFAAAQRRRGEQDPRVEQAYRTLADAFETYDEALYDAFDEVTPFVLYDDVEDEREDDREDDREDTDEDDEGSADDAYGEIDEDDLNDDDADDLPEIDLDADADADANGQSQPSETSSRA